MRYFFDEKYMPKDLGGQTPIVVKVARVICVKTTVSAVSEMWKHLTNRFHLKVRVHSE